MEILDDIERRAKDQVIVLRLISALRYAMAHLFEKYNNENVLIVDKIEQILRGDK